MNFPDSMEKKGKPYQRLQLAVCLKKILDENKETEKTNRERGIEDPRLVTSLRSFESESGISYNIIQGISVGRRDINLTTLLDLVASLRLSFSKFASLFERVTEEEVRKLLADIGLSKRKSKIRKTWKNIINTQAAEDPGPAPENKRKKKPATPRKYPRKKNKKK
jgi:hypothetical protein